jgi:hypothetical protein
MKTFFINVPVLGLIWLSCGPAYAQSRPDLSLFIPLYEPSAANCGWGSIQRGRGYPPRGDDPVFQVKKLPQIFRQQGDQFLPGEDLATDAHFG